VRHLVDAVLHGELRCLPQDHAAAPRLRYEIEFPRVAPGPLSAPMPLSATPGTGLA
jgi:hypothetical protein